ncbi:MAG: hypothetical protein JJ956_18410, partial [Pseudomonadales bacterium]|nr:hypothetical protein [Pseudomonadales bacterium]
GEDLYSDDELKDYRHLFKTKSKVSSHYAALASIIEIDEDQFASQCPSFLTRLIDHSASLLSVADDDG